MLLALMRLWDRNKQAIRITWVVAALREAPSESGKPTCVIAHTVKGRGVGFMENQLAWHYRAPNATELVAALAELEACR